MSEFNKYSTDGGATFLDVEDSNAVHWNQAEGYVGKNKNSMPYYASSGTAHGITKVINADGTVNINNTTTGTDFVEFHQRTLHNNDTDLYLPIGDYYVTIEADKSIDVSKTHFTVNRTVNGSDVGFNTSKNIGSTYHFSITADTTCDYKKADGSCLVGFYVYFDSGLAFDNVTIKPMIRDSSIPDSTYEPWYMSNRELTDNKTDNSVIAPVETGLTASKGYSQDEHFIKDNAFCVALRNISQGDTFVLHTNYEAENIATYLRALYINNSGKHTGVDTIALARIYKDANVFVCNLDFTIGSANIGAWTDDVIIFNKLYNSQNITCAIRDVTDSTKSSIDTVLLKANGTNVGFTTSKQLLANHRYQLSFTFIKM